MSTARTSPGLQEPSRSESISGYQIALWILMAYLFYIAAALLIETYGRKRFGVKRDSEIAQIAEKGPRLKALARKNMDLAEMGGWWPYSLFMMGSVCAWGLLSVIAGIAICRHLIRARSGSIFSIKFIAIGTLLSSSAVLMLGILPPLLIQKAWERYPWLSW